MVCDNASSDGSMDRIAAWADGAQPVEHARRIPAWRAGWPAGPICRCPTVRIDRTMAEQGQRHSDAPLVLIDNGANLGFAAGNNVGPALRPAPTGHGLRLGAQQRHPGRARLPGQYGAAPGIATRTPAVCGSMIHFFDQPEIIQADRRQPLQPPDR